MAKAGTTVKKRTRKAAVKAAPKKIAAKKTVAKKSGAGKIAKKTGMKKGNRYVCGVCGLAVTIDTACGCAETSHLICCEKPMKMKR